jgi:hypothetical protein
MVALGDLERCGAVAIILGQPLDLVIENIGSAIDDEITDTNLLAIVTVVRLRRVTPAACPTFLSTHFGAG